VSGRRDAVADDLRALADDLKSLFESATLDPKERRRKELRWRVLSAALGVLTTVAARRAATKLWAVLTGEAPPTHRPASHAPLQTPTTADVEAVAAGRPDPSID
jgi:hypothetical protein